MKAQINKMILSLRGDETGYAAQGNSEMKEHPEGIHYLGQTQEDIE